MLPQIKYLSTSRAKICSQGWNTKITVIRSEAPVFLQGLGMGTDFKKLLNGSMVNLQLVIKLTLKPYNSNESLSWQ